MARWQGECVVKNVQSTMHGQRRIMTVSADRKDDAREKLREEAALLLFKSTSMFRYVEVQSLSRVH